MPNGDDVEIEWELAGGFLYVGGEVIARGEAAINFVVREAREAGGDPELDLRPDDRYERTARVSGVPEPIALIARARRLAQPVQPNHVFVSHCCGAGGDGCGWGCGCGDECCGTHPSSVNLDLAMDANPFRANPFRANPFRANPFRANPFRANPLCGNPFRANPFRANSVMQTTAVPVAAGLAPAIEEVSGGDADIVVLDTGLDARGALLPWDSGSDDEQPDNDDPPDHLVDAVAGHGTFIAGVIARCTPAATVVVKGLVSPRGVVSEWDVADALQEIAQAETARRAAEQDPLVKVVNMSFGGPMWDPGSLLHDRVNAARVAGVLLVASAGNDGSCRPMYPAAFPEVVAVGAVDAERGPAPFTNYGSWVNACAQGVDVVSTFFDTAAPVTPDFDGWAEWSGTSFAAPLVAAMLARLRREGRTPDEALEQLLDHPERVVPCLGTYVQCPETVADSGS